MNGAPSRLRRMGMHGIALACMAVLAGAAVSGCSLLKPQPDLSRFFVLTSLTDADVPSAEGTPATGGLAITFGPVRFPDYLDRPQIVHRVEENRVAFSEWDRWAEPLDRNFGRVLSQNLTLLLGTDRVLGFPSFAGVAMDYQVPIEIMRFESDMHQEVHLIVRWGVVQPDENTVLHTEESRFVASLSSMETRKVVAAMSGLVADFSRAIALRIQTIHAARTQQPKT